MTIKEQQKFFTPIESIQFVFYGIVQGPQFLDHFFSNIHNNGLQQSLMENCKLNQYNDDTMTMQFI